MERPAAPAPPKPCRPILDEDPLFPRYNIRGVLAAGARRPQSFGGRDGAAGPWGVWARPPRPGPEQMRLSPRPGPPLCWGRGQEEGIEAVAGGDGAARGEKSEVSPGGSWGSRRLWLPESRRPPLSGRCCWCCGPRQSAAAGGGGGGLVAPERAPRRLGTSDPEQPLLPALLPTACLGPDGGVNHTQYVRHRRWLIHQAR